MAKTKKKPEPESSAIFQIAPGPHISGVVKSTQSMMYDVLFALLPVVGMSIYLFRWYAVVQLSICILSCMICEALFLRLRKRTAHLNDGSAIITGLILGLSLPWSAPWYVGLIASIAAIGLAKILFGGLGQNIFNPAMVGRAFVMISFPAALGAAAYTIPTEALSTISQATPLTLAKQQQIYTPLSALFAGTTNGSLGETSAIACIIGGIYLCIRQTASWQIPAGVIFSAFFLGLLSTLYTQQPISIALHHLLSGSLLFGAFFIATDPVTSPLAQQGKWIFGIGTGVLIVFIRSFSGYPEGVMFAVLFMNALTPLINRWTIPRPVGGAVILDGKS